MNWKARSSEFRSGTRKVLPRMVISTSFSYGRNTSAINGFDESDMWRKPLPCKLKQWGENGNRNTPETCLIFQWGTNREVTAHSIRRARSASRGRARTGRDQHDQRVGA